MFQRERHGSVDLIRGADALIVQHLQQLGLLLEEAARGGQPKVVVDLEQVPLIDSAGLEKLLDVRDDFVRMGGALKLLSPNLLCEEILAATGVDEKFEIYSDMRDAVRSFSR